jgi:hypothetical protein
MRPWLVTIGSGSQPNSNTTPCPSPSSLNPELSMLAGEVVVSMDVRMGDLAMVGQDL